MPRMDTTAAKVTLTRLLWAWAALGIGVWLVLVFIAVPEDGTDDLVYVPAWLWVAMYAALVGAAFFFSGLLIAFLWAVVGAWREHRREHFAPVARRRDSR